jgi:hypothetical protein
VDDRVDRSRLALIEETRAIAEASGAHGTMRHIDEARSNL